MTAAASAVAPEAAKRFDVYTSSAEVSGVVQALERAWWAIRERHKDVPAAVILVGPGDSKRGLVWGHFSPSRWAQKVAGKTRNAHEIMISGESLRRPAAETIGTLLHEAAHALAEARSIKDTSRGHRYHNRRYKALAEELGLDVELLEKIGWSGTTMRPATVKLYAAEIDGLHQAQQKMLLAFRQQAAIQEEKPPRASRVKLVCSCERAISVAPGVADEGPILCGLCEEPFQPETE